MKSGTIIAGGACVALTVLALAVHQWRDTIAPESSGVVERGAAGANRAAGTGGRGDGDDGHAAGAEGHARIDGLAGGAPSGSDRADADTASERRTGSSTVVRGAQRSAGSGKASAAGGGALASGDVRLAERSQATKRDVPDLPKQASLTTGAMTDSAGEPAPEVAYDGGADHVFSTKSQVDVPDAGKISGDAGTISFWLKPEWGPNSQDDATFVQLGDSGLQVVKNVNFLRFEYVDQNGTENGLGTNLGEWQNDQWRQVTATWTNGNLTLYVDGQQISQNHYQFPPTFSDETKLYVGSNFTGPVAPGQVSYLTLLNRDSSAAEVAQLFQSGARPRN